MKIYLAGPIRNMPGYNAPAFDYAAAKLRAQGHEVFNPIEESRRLYGADLYERKPDHGGEPAQVDPRRVFANDMAYLCLEANAIALLPGWEKSSGATGEHGIARALGHTIIILGKDFVQA